MSKNNKALDPLYQLFEHYLFNRSYDDTAAFTKEIAQEYLAYLDSTSAHVPFHVRHGLMSDLESEAHELLVKKMYGCVKSSDYENYGVVMEVKTLSHLPFLGPRNEEVEAPNEDEFK